MTRSRCKAESSGVKSFPGGTRAAERLRQRSINGAWMQGGYDAIRPSPRMFDRQGTQYHVQCGFRRSVGYPATKPIIIDAADTSRKCRKHGFAPAPHARKKMLGDKCGANAVDSEVSEKVVAVKVTLNDFSGCISSSCNKPVATMTRSSGALREANAAAAWMLLSCSRSIGNARTLWLIDVLTGTRDKAESPATRSFAAIWRHNAWPIPPEAPMTATYSGG